MTDIQVWITVVVGAVLAVNFLIAALAYRGMNRPDWALLAGMALFGVPMLIGLLVQHAAQKALEPLRQRKLKALNEQLEDIERQLAELSVSSLGKPGALATDLKGLIGKKFELERTGASRARGSSSTRCVQSDSGAQFLLRVDITGRRWRSERAVAKELDFDFEPDVADRVRDVLGLPEDQQYRAADALNEEERDQYFAKRAEIAKREDGSGGQIMFRRRVSDAELTRWTALFTGNFKKAIKRLDRALQGRVLAAVMEIAEDPTHTHGDTIKRLTGDLDGCWRYRLGDYRLVYMPEPDHHRILFIDIASRASIYQ